MKFRNQRHKELFNEAIRRLDKQNNTLMAVVYLFTADNRLWSMTRHGICYSGVDFNHIRLRNCSVGMYTLYCAAKDLYFGTDKLILSDLANPDVATPNVFKIVCNSIEICRMGLNPLCDKERKGS